MTERQRRLLLIGALATLIFSGLMIQRAMSGVLSTLVSPSTPSSREHKPQPAIRSGLDGMMLQIEIPRSGAEVASLAPPRTRPFWRNAIAWDLLFIVGYVALFAGLVFPGVAVASLWERPSYCAAVAGVADLLENGTLIMLLGYLDDGKRISETRALTALPILSAAKWLLVFVAVRACAIQMEKVPRWKWLAVWLRSSATGGSWAAILSLLGLPARPLLGLMTIISAVLLAVAVAMRFIGVPHQPDAPTTEALPAPANV